MIYLNTLSNSCLQSQYHYNSFIEILKASVFIFFSSFFHVLLFNFQFWMQCNLASIWKIDCCLIYFPKYFNLIEDCSEYLSNRLKPAIHPRKTVVFFSLECFGITYIWINYSWLVIIFPYREKHVYETWIKHAGF